MAAVICADTFSTVVISARSGRIARDAAGAPPRNACAADAKSTAARKTRELVFIVLTHHRKILVILPPRAFPKNLS